MLIQVALQTTESNELAAGGVADLVSRINSRFSTLTYQPVVFLHVQDLTFNQYLALLTVADAFIVTSLREGMALRTHEYVECQEGRYRPLVLSEFTGSYSYSGFRSCIPINPWNTKGTADAIYQVWGVFLGGSTRRMRWMLICFFGIGIDYERRRGQVSMGGKSCLSFHISRIYLPFIQDLHNHVITQTAQAFVTGFLNRCVRAHIDHMQDDSISVPPLELSRVLPRYKHSRKRLILVDFEGTLWIRDLSRAGLVGMAKGEYVFPEDVVNVLKKLAEDSRNEVWLLSGLRIDGVLERFREKVPKVGIVYVLFLSFYIDIDSLGCLYDYHHHSFYSAENGCFIKTRAVGSYNGEWINMVSNFNLTWKSACLEILNYVCPLTSPQPVRHRVC